VEKIQMSHDLQEVADVLGDAPVTWAIGGGWAIDLHLGDLGRRPHADVDVVCRLTEADALRDHLAGWDLHRVVDGELDPWTGPLEPSHQIWVRPHSEADWAFEVLFELVTDEGWRFHRNTNVTLPTERLITTITGIPTLHLGIALLYKAKRDDDFDLEDLLACLPVLDHEERAWLADAVAATHGLEHRWVPVLRSP
jgi:hypothetical protein